MPADSPHELFHPRTRGEWRRWLAKHHATAGSWGFLDSIEALEIPADLAAALKRNAKAKKNFDAFPPSSKKIILLWVASAKREETRARRVAETVSLAAKNIRANHYDNAGK